MPLALAMAAWPTASWHGLRLLPALGVYQLGVVVGSPSDVRFMGWVLEPPSENTTIAFLIPGVLRPSVMRVFVAACTAGASAVQPFGCTQLIADTSWLDVFS